ncbi:sentrin/SUMO-specific protease [Ophiocordyceps sinensis CO18]|uniref:Sentrin/SUMO-specific protease n=2 Tax=Ophiocordyceps sinensis TaxID=72228 RepID=T5APL6_OPHSC|nr:sentrin/SUMO-specific protease [Ophiocordyceps sinensis CO18]
MSNTYSTMTAFGSVLVRFLHRTSHTVAEIRTHVRDRDTGALHVANKRCKLSSPEENQAVWLAEGGALEDLVTKGESFLDVLRFICNVINNNPERGQMNKRLRPLQHFLCASPDDHGIIIRGERDLCDAFFSHVENCISVLSSLYNVGYFFTTRKRYSTVPPAVNYELDDEGRGKLGWAQRFLSAPALPTICDDFMRMARANPDECFPTEFADRIILDVQAILCDIPVPSFVVSEEFHGQLRQIFPKPQRTDLEWHLLLPGSFPEDEDEEPSHQETKEATPSPAASAPVTTPPRTPSPPQVIAKTRDDKAAYFYADHLESLISGITPQEFRSEFYKESDVHRTIQSNYITDFVAKEPAKSAEAKLPRSILKNRRKHSSRCTPKRLAQTLPKYVRFTESTLSPRPRSHIGLDVPRLIESDEERKNDYAPAAWSPVGLRPITPSEGNIFTNDGSYDEQDFEDSPFWSRKKGKLPEPSLEERERRAASAMARIEELLDEPTVPGLSSRPVEEILESLKRQNKINLSYKLAMEAKKAEEEAKHRAAEEAKRAEEEAQRRAVEDEQRRQFEEILSQTGGLRPAKSPLISPLSEQWEHEVERAIQPGTTRLLASTGQGVELRRHDFESLIPSEKWLNDEIVNGSLGWLERAINGAAGIKDFRRQTPKCSVMSSFFFKYMLEHNHYRSDRTLRRSGVTKDNLLDIETLIWPICLDSHWTTIVIRPTKRTVVHMDSLNPHGSQRIRNLAMASLKHVLQEKFVESEWQEVMTEAPRQRNSYDCGVFTITNAICLALGLSPIHSYGGQDMALQRHRIAAMLLNGGFKDEFDLQVY